MDSLASEYCPLLNPGPQGRRPGHAHGVYSNSSPKDGCTGYGETARSAREQRRKRWPWFVWFLLKVIGLFNYRRIVTRRRCHLCRLATLQGQLQKKGNENCSYLFPGTIEEQGWGADDEDTGDEALICPVVDAGVNSDTCLGTPGEACAVCQSEWWDAWGVCRPYSETDIGVRKWNHRGSTMSSIIWPSFLIVLIMYDFLVNVLDFWGRDKEVVHFISYSTYLSFSISIPALCLTANVRHLMLDHRGQVTGRRLGSSWYKALGVRYIVKRLQHLELGERGLPCKAYLALCLLWPCLNGFYRLVIYYVYVHYHGEDDYHMQIVLDVGILSMVVWGAFCYLMLLMQRSLKKQQQLELAFIWRHAGALDVCRRRLAVYAEELGSMCRLVSIWITVVLAVSTWAFTTMIMWNYLNISHGIISRKNIFQCQIGVLLWSENIMFLVLPLVAVGGMDLNGMWTHFKLGVSQMRSEAQEAFWDKILGLTEEQSPVHRVAIVMLVFSALGLLLGLHFTDQNMDYWTKRVDLNATSLSLATSDPP